MREGTGSRRAQTHQSTTEALCHHVEQQVDNTGMEEDRDEESERLIRTAGRVDDVEAAEAADVGHGAYGEESVSVEAV